MVGASKRSSNSATDVPVSVDAAERLQREIEKPGAFKDVSKAPVRILEGWMFQVDAGIDLSVRVQLDT